MSRPVGTDGSDFTFRARVDVRYNEVVNAKSHLNKLSALNLALASSWVALFVYYRIHDSDEPAAQSVGWLHVAASLLLALLAFAIGRAAVASNNATLLTLSSALLLLDVVPLLLVLYAALSSGLFFFYTTILPAALLLIKGLQIATGRRLSLLNSRKPRDASRRT